MFVLGSNVRSKTDPSAKGLSSCSQLFLVARHAHGVAALVNLFSRFPMRPLAPLFADCSAHLSDALALSISLSLDSQFQGDTGPRIPYEADGRQEFLLTCVLRGIFKALDVLIYISSYLQRSQIPLRAA